MAPLYERGCPQAHLAAPCCPSSTCQRQQKHFGRNPVPDSSVKANCIAGARFLHHNALLPIKGPATQETMYAGHLADSKAQVRVAASFHVRWWRHVLQFTLLHAGEQLEPLYRVLQHSLYLPQSALNPPEVSFGGRCACHPPQRNPLSRRNRPNPAAAPAQSRTKSHCTVDRGFSLLDL